ncbi:unnamed protein product [Penicillium glandicola]
MDRNRIQTSRVSCTTPHTTSSLQTPKLKDSCDKCSSSKEKPFCTRCDKLGYTCFYSPARRAGRPYRSKNQSSEGTDSQDPNRPSTRDITTTQFVDESARLYSRSNASSTLVNVTSDNPILNSTPRANSTRLSNETERLDPSTSKGHDASDLDCVLVVLDILSELEMQAEQLRRAYPEDASLLNTTAQTITATFHRLSTILICSCSERAEVGMLVSAICMSIIDMHAMTIAKFAKNQLPTGLLSQPMPWDSLGVGVHRYPEREDIGMKVLTELSELARLILQFTERYKEGSGVLNSEGLRNGSELPTDFLPEMATFLRGRLQQIRNDATYWLV